MNSALIPFGLKGDRMVGVGEVAAGLACDCICPACLERLVAKKGTTRVHHFAHVASDVNCNSGAETAIHRMAKQCLLDAKRVHTPGLTCTETASNDEGFEFVETEVVCDADRFSFDSVVIEAEFGEYRPDVIGWADDRPLLVEIAVRHRVGQDKAEGLELERVRCIEIDLSKVDPATITVEELSRLVLDEPKTKRWIAHPDRAAVREKLRDRLKERIEKSNAAARDRKRARLRPLPSLKPQLARAPARCPAPAAYSHRWLICESCRTLHNAGPYQDAMLLEEFICRVCGFSVGLDPPRASAWGGQG